MTEQRNIDDARIDDAMAYLIDGEYFTGELIETLPNGCVIELTTVNKGMVDGPQRAWYADGKLKYEAYVARSRVVGTAREWHPDGTLAEESEFDERGKLVCRRSWTPDGKETL
jgi:antitoxin component YwqK of YwqJK toxin-antitoxin module